MQLHNRGYLQVHIKEYIQMHSMGYLQIHSRGYLQIHIRIYLQIHGRIFTDTRYSRKPLSQSALVTPQTLNCLQLNFLKFITHICPSIVKIAETPLTLNCWKYSKTSAI